MSAWFGYSPQDVDELSLRDVAVMLEGAKRRRAESWFLNSRLCALIENTAFGKEGEAATAIDYLPPQFRPGEQEEELTAAERWQRALEQDKAKTDRKNEERAKKGLPPLPYKEL